MKIDELAMEPVYQYTVIAKVNELVRAHNDAELSATDSQQLQAKIRALVAKTVKSQNRNVDVGELLVDLLDNLRVLSAM